jgi:lipoprotein-anchoring transpeptidase ErfK/SrfK
MPRAALVLTVFVAVVAGCGGEAREDEAAVHRDAPPPSSSTPGSPTPSSGAASSPSPARCELGSSRSYAGRGIAAVALGPTVAFRKPGRVAVARFERLNVNRVPTTFRVLEARLGPDCRPSWYRVQLPIRPNGAEGWIRSSAVRRYAVEYRIVVDLSDRQITVYRNGGMVVRTRTAIGRPETPTPTGSFYVNQRLLAADPAGPWGPGGIGISAFSPTLPDWPQGGPIAIHGTNQPESIGQVMSNGCMRIDNAVLERLIHAVPDGTPVRIRA